MKSLTALLLLFSATSLAQTSTPLKMEKLGTVDPSTHDVNWAISMTKHKYPTPGGDDYWSELERRKAIVGKRYPRKETSTSRGGGPIPTDSLPWVGYMFEGNAAGNGTPNDNNMAISNSGFLVSVVNSNLYFYDMNTQTELYNNTLGAWTLPLNITSNKFDPKVIYDPLEDRFILVFLNGTGSLSSKYIVCFSTSDDPMDPWNMYKLDGNPLADNSWSDYPALAITKEDLFLTINLLTPGQSWQLGFKQSVIWQIEKRSGYEGDSLLNTNLWTGVQHQGTNIRNLHPVRNARGQFENQNRIFFLSNKNFATESDTIFLVEITEALTSGNATMNIDMIHSDSTYFLAVNAPEPGGQLLATNDSRVLGGIIEGNTIQFVQNGTDTTTGNSAIYHGFLDIQSLTCTGRTISDSVLNFGYANIAGVSPDPGDQESIITFEYTSPNDFPGFASIYYDGNGTYSPVKILKTGENKISVFNDPVERWGDYSGIQRRYNDPCKVWACGTYGKSNQDNGTWIVEIGSDSICTALPTDVSSPAITPTHLVFPNPAREMVNYQITLENRQDLMISLYDANGKLIQELLRDELSSGEYNFTFNTAHLPTGLYILQGSGTKEFQLNEKLVVE